MKKRTWLAGLAIAMGLGAVGASAQEWRGRDSRDYPAAYTTGARVDRLRAEIARDRMRLNENLRHGRYAAAQRNREELMRDQRELNALLRVSRDGWHR